MRRYQDRGRLLVPGPVKPHDSTAYLKHPPRLAPSHDTWSRSSEGSQRLNRSHPAQDLPAENPLAAGLILALDNSTTTPPKGKHNLEETEDMEDNRSPKNPPQSLTDFQRLASDSINTPVASNKLALSNRLHSLHSLHSLHNLRSLHSLEQTEGTKVFTTTPLKGMQP